MKKMDVFGIGNALVDTLAYVDDAFIAAHSVARGTMTLISDEKQRALLADLSGKDLEMKSGGSAANTMHGIALLGGTGYYAGKVAGDDFGSFYKNDLEKAGIRFEVPPAKSSQGLTGSCLVLTTPDAERSMLTHLGISSTLSLSDLNFNDLKKCKILYIEGYMWDGDHQKEACLEAMKFARKNGITATLTFSDPFCVERSREDFIRLCRDSLDVVFCNADEVRAFTGKKDFDAAINEFKTMVKKAFVTNSEKGAIVLDQGSLLVVPGFPVKPKDTTGAGDAFAAGALYGLSHNKTSYECARLGNFLGSRIVQKHGARLEPAEISDWSGAIRS